MYSFTDRQIGEIRGALENAQGKANYQRIMAVWLRAKCHMDAQSVADAIGWSVNSVHRVQSRYFSEGCVIFEGPGRGGRRNVNFSHAQEVKLLAPFLKEAENGEVLIVSEIHRAYEEKLGKRVPPSTIYRMLARYGWRKIAPRPSHPKADTAAQETFKKTS
jgi:transposase